MISIVRRRVTAISFLGALAVPAAAEPLDGAKVIVTVGGEPITAAALNVEIAEEARLLQAYDRVNDPEARRAALDRLIERRLFYLAALADVPGSRGVADSIAAHEMLRACWDDLLGTLHPGPEALTDSAIADYRKARASWWFVRQIVVDTREEADDVFRRLAAGEAFDDLAKKVSTDIGSAAAGGRVYPFRYEDVPPGIWDLSQTLAPGSYGGPVETRIGFHVLQCDSVLFSPEDELIVTDEYLRLIRRRAGVFAGIEELLAELSRAHEIVPDEAGVDLVHRNLRGSGSNVAPPTIDPGFEPPDDVVVVRSGGAEPITVAEFLRYFEVLGGYHWPYPRNRPSVRTAAVRLMVAKILCEERDRGERTLDPELEAKALAVVHRVLGNQYLEKRVHPASPDLAEAEAIFEASPEAFLLSESASIAAIGVKSRAIADSVETWLSNGTAFDAAGRRAMELDPEAYLVPQTSFFPRGRYPTTDELIFSFDIGEVSRPLPAEGEYQIYKLMDRRPARPARRMELSDDQLRERAWTFLVDGARAERLSDLRARFAVENREDLERALRADGT